MGAAMNSVSSAVAAVSRGRFNELARVAGGRTRVGAASLGQMGRRRACHGHETALAVMRRGLAAQGMITVRGFVEQGRQRARARGASRTGRRRAGSLCRGRNQRSGPHAPSRGRERKRSSRRPDGGIAAGTRGRRAAASGGPGSRSRSGVSRARRCGAGGARGRGGGGVGENGAGKSTLLRICAGLEPPHAGHGHRRGRARVLPRRPWGLFDLPTADEHPGLFPPAASASSATRESARAVGCSRSRLPGRDRAQARPLSGGARQKSTSDSSALLGRRARAAAGRALPGHRSRGVRQPPGARHTLGGGRRPRDRDRHAPARRHDAPVDRVVELTIRRGMNRRRGTR